RQRSRYDWREVLRLSQRVRMRHAIFALAAFLPIALATDDASGDKGKIEGRWSLSSIQRGGESPPEDERVNETVIVIKDGKLTSRLRDQLREFTYRLDPTQT